MTIQDKLAQIRSVPVQNTPVSANLGDIARKRVERASLPQKPEKSPETAKLGDKRVKITHAAHEKKSQNRAGRGKAKIAPLPKKKPLPRNWKPSECVRMIEFWSSEAANADTEDWKSFCEGIAEMWRNRLII